MDFMILDGIQKLHSPLLDTLFVCITRLGDKGFVWWFYCKYNWKQMYGGCK